MSENEVFSNEEQTNTSRKKHWIFISIAMAVILLAVAGGTIFCIKTCDMEPAPTEFTLSGTWKMYTMANNYTNNDSNTKYLDFVGDNVKVYVGESTTPILTTSFTLKLAYDKSSLEIKDVKTYEVLHQYTEDYLHLYDEESDIQYILVKSNSKNLNKDYSNVYGTWNGVYKHTEPVNDKFVITSSNISLYENMQATTPQRSFDLSITTDGVLVFASFNYEIAYLSESRVILVSLIGDSVNKSGSVYILNKAQ